MQRDRILWTHSGSWLGLLVTLLFGSVGLPAIAHAQADPAAVYRVEEDWELRVDTPDPDNNGPQIINVISPTADIKSQHAVLELNHQTFPVFYGGGLQLQMWTGEILNQFSNSKSVSRLDKPSETITYTLGMQVSDGELTVEVLNGKGSTWSAFGEGSRLTVKRKSSVSSLNGYSYSVSTKRSQVSYGGNRVKQLKLKEVRRYDEDGELIDRFPLNIVVH